jgi:hypothetical protein
MEDSRSARARGFDLLASNRVPARAPFEMEMQTHDNENECEDAFAVDPANEAEPKPKNRPSEEELPRHSLPDQLGVRRCRRTGRRRRKQGPIGVRSTVHRITRLSSLDP